MSTINVSIRLLIAAFFVAASAQAQWLPNGPTIEYFNGNVGINTSAPQNPLSVTGTGVLANFWASAGAYLSVGENVNPTAGGLGRMQFGYSGGPSGYSSLESFTQGGAGRNLILNSTGGNVGINTLTPQENLVVFGSNIKPIIGSSTHHSNLYPGYDGQAWTSLEVQGSSGGQGSNLVLSTAGGNPGGMWFVNKGAGTEGANDLRLAGFYVSTDGVVNSGLLQIFTANAGTMAERFRIDHAGNVLVTGSLTATSGIAAVYQDVAEWVVATEKLAPGTVVVLNPAKSNEVMPSHSAYDITVAGVVSEQPGLLLGQPGATKEAIAATGRVKVRVDARQHPIRVGDLLVTSDELGTAMKSEPIDIGGRKIHQPGTIIGKALEPLPDGVGEILVLLSLG